MAACTLVFPFQLFASHPAIERGRPVVLLEDSLVFGGDVYVGLAFHRKKLVLHRASMQAYAARLRRAGHEVRYVDYEKGATTVQQVRALPFDEVFVCDPVDFLISKRLARSGVTLRLVPTPMFVSPEAWLADQFGSGKRPFLARFYERQRKRLGVLVDDAGRPEGGRWSFDDENRRPMPKRGTTSLSRCAYTDAEPRFADPGSSGSESAGLFSPIEFLGGLCETSAWLEGVHAWGLCPSWRVVSIEEFLGI